MEERILQLEREVRRLQARLSRLEGRDSLAEPEAALEPAAAGPVAAAAASADGRLPVGAALGRGILILGGAVILRAITERGLVGQVTGFALGYLYAIFWLGVTARLRSRPGSRRALGYGLASVLIGYPLLWEAGNGLALVPPALAVLLLGATLTAGLAVCVRRGQRWLAWVFLLGGLLLTVGYFHVSTAKPWALGVLLVTLATTWAMASRSLWEGLRWPTALLADFYVFLVIHHASSAGRVPGGGFPGASGTVALALSLTGISLGFVAWSALVRRRELGPFCAIQAAAAVAAGIGGSAAVVRSGQGSPALVGGLAMALAAGFTLGAFLHLGKARGRGVNFYFFAYLGLALVLLGTRILLPGPWLIGVWLALALGAVAVGVRSGRATLCGQGLVYVTAAAVAAGMPWAAARAPWPPGAPSWPGAALLAVTATALVGRFLLSRFRGEGERWGVRWSGLGLLVLGTLGAVGVVAQAAQKLLDLGGLAGPETAAMVRTVVHAAAAVALALIARRRPLWGLGLLVLPVLVVTGGELVLLDLRVCGSVALAVCFLAYGGALIVAARLRR